MLPFKSTQLILENEYYILEGRGSTHLFAGLVYGV
jgi:hypothetical protein